MATRTTRQGTRTSDDTTVAGSVARAPQHVPQAETRWLPCDPTSDAPSSEHSAGALALAEAGGSSSHASDAEGRWATCAAASSGRSPVAGAVAEAVAGRRADLLSVLRAAAAVTHRVLVAFSGGKDSVVTLDLCAQYFDHIDAFFMYQVPDLSFQERELRWAEGRYGIAIARIPHFDTAEMLRFGLYHDPDSAVPAVGIADIYAYMREKTGTFWIAAGERIADSIVRRAMILKSGTIDEDRGRFYPLAHWRKRHVEAYIQRRGLRVSEESFVLGHSFRDLSPETLVLVKKYYPKDYQRILGMFPLAEAAVKRVEFYGDRRDRKRQPR